MKKVCHLTSVHPRYDTRIFVKECSSLHKNGFDVNLIVADNLGDELVNNIKIHDVGKEISRIKRIRKTPYKVYKKALEINADIYHFHDPELISTGRKLIKKGKKVIYDIHEDVPLQILSKPYLNPILRKIISVLFSLYENKNVKNYSYVITATDFIREKIRKLNKRTESVKNFPVIDELKSDVKWVDKKNIICYVGAISKIRGITEIVQALDNTNCKLNIAGKFVTEDFKNEVINLKSWNKVIDYGFVGRNQVKKIYEESKIGLVTLYPTINYKDALPVKMFEYMLAGIPVISSKIPLWQKIIDENQCGICVDPYKPAEIAEAVNKLLSDDNLAEKMGKNGQKVVIQKYNWANEEKKLIEVYKKI